MKLTSFLLAGLPNVGKSLLFNKLTQTKNAIVSEHEGFTRDVRYGFCSFDDKSECEIIDTAGFISEKKNVLTDSITFFTRNAIFEADNIIYIFDANEGIQLYDYYYLEFLRKSNKNVIPVVNKCEGKKIDLLLLDFSELGFNEFIFISALHNSGIFELKEKLSFLNSVNTNSTESKFFKVGVIGKSNVGKSTLLNTILKSDRFITSSQENTTRESNDSLTFYGDINILFSDTAGLFKKNKKDFSLLSLNDAYNTIEFSDIIFLVVEASKKLSIFEKKIISYLTTSKKNFLLILNKSDLIANKKFFLKKYVDENLLQFTNSDSFLIILVSAKHHKGMRSLELKFKKVYKLIHLRFSTGKLMRTLNNFLKDKPILSTSKNRIPKIKYLHQGRINPVTLIFYGKNLNYIQKNFMKHMERYFIKSLDLNGSQIRFIFKN